MSFYNDSSYMDVTNADDELAAYRRIGIYRALRLASPDFSAEILRFAEKLRKYRESESWDVTLDNLLVADIASALFFVGWHARGAAEDESR